MIKFSQYIEEAFNSPYKFSGGQRDNDLYSYKFDTLDVKKQGRLLSKQGLRGSRVDVMITGSESPEDEDEYMWELSFSRQHYGSDKTRYDVTGEVIAISNDFIKRENPKYVVFGAEKSKDSGGSKELQSREKLYLRMAKKYFGNKYNIRMNAGSRESLFFLDRKK
jgi:hypothetical protein